MSSVEVLDEKEGYTSKIDTPVVGCATRKIGQDVYVHFCLEEGSVKYFNE